MVQLTDQLVAELDAEAALNNVSRSALIRQAIDELLSNRRSTKDIDRYIQGYRRVPQSTPDEWGDLAKSADRSGHDLAKRLETEEADAGLEW